MRSVPHQRCAAGTFIEVVAPGLRFTRIPGHRKAREFRARKTGSNPQASKLEAQDLGWKEQHIAGPGIYGTAVWGRALVCSAKTNARILLRNNLECKSRQTHGPMFAPVKTNRDQLSKHCSV